MSRDLDQLESDQPHESFVTVIPTDSRRNGTFEVGDKVQCEGAEGGKFNVTTSSLIKVATINKNIKLFVQIYLSIYWRLTFISDQRYVIKIHYVTLSWTISTKRNTL